MKCLLGVQQITVAPLKFVTIPRLENCVLLNLFKSFISKAVLIPLKIDKTYLYIRFTISKACLTVTHHRICSKSMSPSNRISRIHELEWISLPASCENF
ncbi:hypothetical protein AVEN_144467-1 [Araneus ventricosus]|uniref:Uncharacterized protein n=1 Tax=Araneus ventricosus TaxID=182803 RepID=A0A4Y2E159_ARAVE|nr:hypothetical protein AVEN_144467-1 [Araneus ventricosus]